MQPTLENLEFPSQRNKEMKNYRSIERPCRSLQGLINIIGHYGKRYRLVFGADKTKVTITGSKHGILYYQDINNWSLYGDKLEVSENSEHLGLVVSAIDEEI